MNIVEFKKNLGSLIERNELPLPSNVSVEAFRNAAVVAFTDNPKIANCTPESVFQSLRSLAAKGLVPDGTEAALVPFKAKVNDQWVEKCQDMVMVAGLIKRARNSGEIRDIRAHIVYQNEVDQGRFIYRAGDHEELEHDPIVFGEKGPAVGCYAIAILKDGTIIRSLMDASQVDHVRRAGNSQKIFKSGKAPVVSDTPIGIWAQWPEQMWEKTVLRRLCKRLPLSTEDKRWIQASDDNEFSGMKDITPQRKSLQDRMAEERAANEQPSESPPPSTATEPALDNEKGEPLVPGAGEGAESKQRQSATEKPAVRDADVEDAEVLEDRQRPPPRSEAPDASGALPEELDGPFMQILADLKAAADGNAIDGIEQLFAEQIDRIRSASDEAAEDLNDALTEARARVG